MTKKDDHKDPALVSIGSMFETGKIRKMYTLAELYPTRIAKSLGINYGRYMVKLNHPDKFTMGEIVKLADFLDIEGVLLFKGIKSLGQLGHLRLKFWDDPVLVDTRRSEFK